MMVINTLFLWWKLATEEPCKGRGNRREPGDLTYIFWSHTDEFLKIERLSCVSFRIQRKKKMGRMHICEVSSLYCSEATQREKIVQNSLDPIEKKRNQLHHVECKCGMLNNSFVFTSGYSTCAQLQGKDQLIQDYREKFQYILTTRDLVIRTQTMSPTSRQNLREKKQIYLCFLLTQQELLWYVSHSFLRSEISGKPSSFSLKAQ